MLGWGTGNTMPLATQLGCWCCCCCCCSGAAPLLWLWCFWGWGRWHRRAALRTSTQAVVGQAVNRRQKEDRRVLVFPGRGKTLLPPESPKCFHKTEYSSGWARYLLSDRPVASESERVSMSSIYSLGQLDTSLSIHASIGSTHHWYI